MPLYVSVLYVVEHCTHVLHTMQVIGKKKVPYRPSPAYLSTSSHDSPVTVSKGQGKAPLMHAKQYLSARLRRDSTNSNDDGLVDPRKRLMFGDAFKRPSESDSDSSSSSSSSASSSSSSSASSGMVFTPTGQMSIPSSPESPTRAKEQPQSILKNKATKADGAPGCVYNAQADSDGEGTIQFLLGHRDV